MKIRNIMLGNILIRKREYKKVSSDIGYIVSTDAVYKENAKLMKLSDNRYVDMDSIHSVWDILKIKLLGDNPFHKEGTILISNFDKLSYAQTLCYHYGVSECLHVDESSLRALPNQKLLSKTLKRSRILM